jgi:hypothetical protein
MIKMFGRICTLGLMISGAVMLASAQPGPIPAGGNTNCNETAGTDTLPYIPDKEGFSFLFDGMSPAPTKSKAVSGWQIRHLRPSTPRKRLAESEASL